MRVPEDELHDLSLDVDRLRLEVRGRKGVMGERRAAQRTRGRDQQDDEVALHRRAALRRTNDVRNPISGATSQNTYLTANCQMRGVAPSTSDVMRPNVAG